MNHASGAAVVALVYWAARLGKNVTGPDHGWVGLPVYYVLLCMTTLPYFSVPLFTFASGAFVAYTARSGSGQIPLVARWRWFRSLLAPCLVWSAAFVGLSGAWYVVAQTFRPDGDVWQPLTLVSNLAVAYYYVPVLGMLFLLAPALVWASARHPVGLLTAAALFQVPEIERDSLRFLGIPVPRVLDAVDGLVWAASGRFPPAQVVRHFLWLLLFFSLGLVTARHYTSIRPRLVRLRRWLVAAATVAGALVLLHGDLAYRLAIAKDATRGDPVTWTASLLLYMVLVVLVLGTWERGRGKPTAFLEYLGVRSFGIFVMQFVVIEYLVRVIYVLAPRLMGMQLLFVPLVFAAGLGVPLMCMAAIANSPVHTSYRLLFGATPTGRARRTVTRRFAGAWQPAVGQAPARTPALLYTLPASTAPAAPAEPA
jgi:hypothetical protein